MSVALAPRIVIYQWLCFAQNKNFANECNDRVAEDEVGELAVGEEDDEEHDGESADVAGALQGEDQGDQVSL
jgi:hypothetical protein